jgi:hypothetical protein
MIKPARDSPLARMNNCFRIQRVNAERSFERRRMFTFAQSERFLAVSSRYASHNDRPAQPGELNLAGWLRQ